MQKINDYLAGCFRQLEAGPKSVSQLIGFRKFSVKNQERFVKQNSNFNFLKLVPILVTLFMA